MQRIALIVQKLGECVFVHLNTFNQLSCKLKVVVIIQVNADVIR